MHAIASWCACGSAPNRNRSVLQPAIGHGRFGASAPSPPSDPPGERSMAASLNITIFINPAGNQRGEYFIELREGEKSIAQVQTSIDRQALLEHEHKYSPHDYGMELYDAVFTAAISQEYQRLVGRAGAETTVRV